jgi:hypothetical protein
MTDIVSVGNDIGLFDTQTCRAANILSVQLKALEYAPNLGIDLKYFLDENFRFQNASFKAYLIEILANNSINVASVVDTIDKLFHTYSFNLSADDKSGLIAR